MFLMTLESALWIVLLIFFSISIYVWSKGQIANETVSLLITIFIVYIVFFKFTDLVWFIAILVVVYWIYGTDIKNALRIKIK